MKSKSVFDFIFGLNDPDPLPEQHIILNTKSTNNLKPIYTEYLITRTK